MGASIPTPFNFGRTASRSDSLFDSNDTSDGGTLDTSGGDATGNIKSGGGLPSNTGGMQFTVISGKAGTRHYFNSTPYSLNFTSTGEKRIFIWAAQANAGNRRQLSTMNQGGQSIKMYSGSDTTSEIREWVLGGSDTKLANRTGIFLFVVDPEATGNVADVGTFDPSSVLRYGHFTTHGDMVGGSTSWWFWCASVLVSSEKDSTKIPRIYGLNSSWQDLVDEVQGTTGFTGQNHLYVEKSGNKIDLFCPCAIGNASQENPTQTTFNDSGLNVISPPSAEASDPRFHLTNDSMRFYLDLRNDPADTATFSETYNWGTQTPFDFSQSNSASITLSGATFTGMGEFTCGSSVSGNATFNLGGTNKVIINGANLNGSTINGDADVIGGTVTTFININITGVLNLDTEGTYTLNNCQINEIKNNSDGAITIILTNGASVTTSFGITITEPVDITNTNILNNSRVKITNITKSLTLDNSVVNGGLGYFLTVNLQDANVDVGDTIRLEAAYQSETTAKKQLTIFGVLTSTGLGFIDTQEDLTAYTDLGIDGSTVSEYNIDSNTGHLQIDAFDADCESLKKRIVARYYYLITTADGIDRFFGIIFLEDAGNAVIRRRLSGYNLMVDNIGNCQIILSDSDFRLYTDDGSAWILSPSTGGYGFTSDSGKVYVKGQKQLENKVDELIDREDADIYISPTSYVEKKKGTDVVIVTKNYTTDGQGNESLTETT